MLQRALLAKQVFSVAAILTFVSQITAAHAGDGRDAFPAPVSSGEMDQKALEACDREASAFGGYDPAIAAAIDDLAMLGVFAPEEFQPVKIGFCDLRSAGGPVGTTSCASDTILLDRNYADNDQRLVLTSTLAHEMKHVLQHKEQKSRNGPGYCDSTQYEGDKQWMEAEADAFGDNVSALALVGRPVEIVNKCSAAVDIYLAGDELVFENGSARGFHTVPAKSEFAFPATTTSKTVDFYAVSEGERRARWVWRDVASGNRHNIDGQVYSLKRTALWATVRSRGPFRLQLTCPARGG